MAKIKFYNILLNLQKLNLKLTQSQDYDEINLCRYELLSYIEETPFLSNIFNKKRQGYIKLSKTADYKNWLEQLKSTIKTVQTLYTIEKNINIRTRKYKSFEQVEIIETQEYCMDFPQFLYFPSLYMLKPIKNIKWEKLKIGLIGFYRMWGTELLNIFVNASFSSFNLEYFLIDKDMFNFNPNIGKYFLWCLVHKVNTNLQAEINNKISPLNKIETFDNAKLPILKYNKTEQRFYLDNNPIDLQPAQQTLLAYVGGFYEVDLNSACKNKITAQKKVNSKFKEYINGTIIKSKDKKFFINSNVVVCEY